MTSQEIRRSFVDFFVGKGHAHLPSASLVPDAMSSTLFTIAGMEPFVGVFLGNEAAPAPRVVTVQRCLRVAGGKNDLENVGRSGRHGTFLEMLGNFSFGDYYKREAIAWAWEYLTKDLRISPDRLHATVYVDDEEAERIWLEQIGLVRERVTRRREDNFWDMGPTGPCGPCSEIFYDLGPQAGCKKPTCGVGCADCERYVEIWNLVFQQYDRDASGAMHPLPKQCIDTGMGFERLCMVLAGATSIFDTDLYLDIIRELPPDGETQLAQAERAVHRRIIADHARAAVFMVADGIAPSNTDRGYVLRFLTRRAIRSGRLLGLPDGFFSRLAPAVIRTLVDGYPELASARERVGGVLEAEERLFDKTLARGSQRLAAIVETRKRDGATEISGRDVFELHDTYGFPPELTAEIARDAQLSVDMAGYRAAMDEQRERARRDSKSKRAEVRVSTPEASHRAGADSAAAGDSLFVGSTNLETTARVVALYDDKGAPVNVLSAGAGGAVVLDRTPFYAERGGQMGDRGVLARGTAAFGVTDTYYQDKTYRRIFHAGSMRSRGMSVGDVVEAIVDPAWRREIRRHHSVTHLLQRALKDVVGELVAQRGSQVYPDRTRFDFDAPGALSKIERSQVASRVNELIRADYHIVEDEMPFGQAVARGAIYMKGERYGDVVRVVQFGPSIELCGGTHVASTGEIGHFVLLGDSAIGAGIRRVEGVVSESADRFVERVRSAVDDVGHLLSAPPEKITAAAEKFAERQRELEKQIAALRAELAAAAASQYLAAAKEKHGIKYLAVRAPHDGSIGVKELSESLRSQWPSGVIAVAHAAADKVSIVVTASADAVERGISAKDVLAAMLGHVDGKGGGSPAAASGGGKNPAGLDAALAAIEGAIDKARHA